MRNLRAIWSESTSIGAKTLLIGLDSEDTRHLDALLAEGVCPILAGLGRSLRRIKIENYAGMGEGVFWPSAATGLKPSEHGRYFCVQFDPKTYSVHPFSYRKTKLMPAIWDRLDADGSKVAVIDWPRSRFSRLANGLVLDDWLTHDPIGPMRSHPPQLAAAVVAKYGVNPFGEGGLCARGLRTREDYDWLIAATLARIGAKTRFAVDQLKARDWDLFCVVFQEPHDVGHYAFHVGDPRHPRHDPEIAAHVGEPRRRTSMAVDRAVGEIMEAAGRGVEIVILSGPGMARLVTANEILEQILRRLDLGLEAARSPVEKAQVAYRNHIPMGLRRRLTPIARGLLGRVINPDYRRRRFFAVPHNPNAGCIRLNLKGRERYGAVDVKDRDRVIASLSADLRALKDADTGAPIVERIVRPDDDGPFTNDLPDLFVIWGRDRRPRRIASDKIGVIENPDVARTGDHTDEGAIWALPGRLVAAQGRAFIRPHEAAKIILDAARRRPIMDGSLKPKDDAVRGFVPVGEHLDVDDHALAHFDPALDRR